MASVNGEETATDQVPERNATESDADATSSDTFGRATDLYAYQSLSGAAAAVGRAVRAALDATSATGKVLLLDDWNPLQSGVLLEKIHAALDFHAARLARSKEDIEQSLSNANAKAMDAREATPEANEGTADFGGILADLKRLHEWLQPAVTYAPRDLTFDADAVRSAVAGALAQPPAKHDVFMPALRQIDLQAGLPLLKRLQAVMDLRASLDQTLVQARSWIAAHLDSSMKAEMERLVKAGEETAKAFDAYLEALFKLDPPILEQALIHQAALNIGATHVLAVKPVLAVSQTTNVRAFPLLNENQHLGASVLAYTLATLEGKVCAAGIADADKRHAVQPHRANQLLAWLLGAVAVLLALFLLFGAGTLSLAGFRALLTAANPPVSATVAPEATPLPTQPASATPQVAPGG